MSASSITGGRSRLFSHMTAAILLVIGLVMATAVACNGDGDNIREDTANALSSLPANADDAAVRQALDVELDDTTLNSVDSAVKVARTERDATIAQIANALFTGNGNGRDDTVRIINGVNASSTANPTPTGSGTPSTAATATPTGTPGATPLTEEKVKQIAEEAARKAVEAAGATGLTYEQVQKAINDAVTRAVSEFNKNKGLTEAQVREIINDALKNISGGPGKPGPSTTPPTGGEKFTTTCGTFTWGPAGPAPGADTDDSGEQVREAISVMKVPDASAQFVTIHKACPGDDVPNGWIIGSSYTESKGIRVSADFLPAGVCVDYDPNVTKLKGDIEHTQKFHDRWSRSFLVSDGSIETLKTTVYWTPCVFTDGYVVKTTSVTKTVHTSSTSGFSCSNLPTKAADLVTVFPNTKESSWAPNPEYKHGWIYNGPDVKLTWVEGVHHFNYDGGTTKEGETPPEGSAFTVWFCK